MLASSRLYIGGADGITTCHLNESTGALTVVLPPPPATAGCGGFLAPTTDGQYVVSLTFRTYP